MKMVSVKLSEALEAQLTALIRQRRTSKATVVRAALEAYLTRQGNPAGVSVLDVVQDLCGCVEGPVNLSTRREAPRDPVVPDVALWHSAVMRLHRRPMLSGVTQHVGLGRGQVHRAEYGQRIQCADPGVAV